MHASAKFIDGKQPEHNTKTRTHSRSSPYLFKCQMTTMNSGRSNLEMLASVFTNTQICPWLQFHGCNSMAFSGPALSVCFVCLALTRIVSTVPQMAAQLITTHHHGMFINRTGFKHEYCLMVSHLEMTSK